MYNFFSISKQIKQITTKRKTNKTNHEKNNILKQHEHIWLHSSHSIPFIIHIKLDAHCALHVRALHVRAIRGKFQKFSKIFKIFQNFFKTSRKNMLYVKKDELLYIINVPLFYHVRTRMQCTLHEMHLQFPCMYMRL